jgi:hypothetical protein
MPESVYTKESLADGQIVGYRFVSTGAEAAEEWYREVVELFFNWDQSKPLLLLIDLSKPDNVLSPEALRAAREASHSDVSAPGKTALLIDANAPAQNVSALVEHVLGGSRERRIFDNETAAIAWLLEP